MKKDDQFEAVNVEEKNIFYIQNDLIVKYLFGRK